MLSIEIFRGREGEERKKKQFICNEPLKVDRLIEQSFQETDRDQNHR